jgi:Holliday junction resolvase
LSINSRNKGASFERSLALDLFKLTGVSFSRNLEQSRAQDQSDLIPDDDAWPFAIEAKRYAKGVGPRNEWIAQVEKAAAKIGKFPALIWKYDREPIRVTIPMEAVAAAFGEKCNQGEWVEMTPDAFAMLASEIMARRAA